VVPKKGFRSYTWVKSRLQEAGLVEQAKKRATHRKKRERAPLLKMMIHQSSTHEWILGQKWDLIIRMDATHEHYSMFFVEEEGATSSFKGAEEVIGKHGLLATFYSDRGSQSLSKRNLYACFQYRIYTARHKGKNSFRSVDWRTADRHLA